MSGADARPLAGLRVLELGQILAGPFAGAMLGYFGADVVKVEPPGSGDPIRSWRLLDDDGTSLWWRSLGRNKRCVTLDLGTPDGQALARRLAARADVLIENFRPGTMEGWGLGPDRLCAENPGLVFARVSGFGQTGPYAARPGYASVCEAFGGLRHLTGNPGEVPVRANLSLGDSLAGLHAVVGILLALEAATPERARSGRRRFDLRIGLQRPRSRWCRSSIAPARCAAPPDRRSAASCPRTPIPRPTASGWSSAPTTARTSAA